MLYSMVTLKGKNADRFIRKMIKKENSPISKKDKKLAKEIKENMSKLQIECQECYDKIKKSNTWYKVGRKEAFKEVEKILDEYDTNDWREESFHTINMEIKHRLEKLESKKEILTKEYNKYHKC